MAADRLSSISRSLLQFFSVCTHTHTDTHTTHVRHTGLCQKGRLKERV